MCSFHCGHSQGRPGRRGVSSQVRLCRHLYLIDACSLAVTGMLSDTEASMLHRLQGDRPFCACKRSGEAKNNNSHEIRAFSVAKGAALANLVKRSASFGSLTALSFLPRLIDLGSCQAFTTSNLKSLPNLFYQYPRGILHGQIVPVQLQAAADAGAQFFSLCSSNLALHSCSDYHQLRLCACMLQHN